MTLEHRHLTTAPDTPPEQLPLDALDDLLDRGSFDDWRSLARAVRQDPRGALADRILGLCAAHEMYGTSRLWPAFITRVRGQQQRRTASVRLAELRRHAGRTQGDVALTLGISQSDVSKLERRDDVRLSTLRQYVEALGARLEIVAVFEDADRRVAVQLGKDSAG